MKKLNLKNIYLLYTCSFLLLLPIIFLPFIMGGKTFVWNIDGIRQHFPILQYYGRLLREFFSGNGFPMVDFKLGLGFDTLTTIHYYVLGDPIALLSVFVTPENAIFFYGIIILLRFYLAGISFIIFSKYWGKDGLGVTLGALIYVFCGYTFFAGVRHPFFLNPMIYFPLIIIGLEQMLRRKKPYLIIIMAFISTASNFYFHYILTVLAIIYVIFRYFYTYRKSFKNVVIGFFETGFKIGGYYLLGTAMASIIFIPVIYAFMQNGRYDSGAQMLFGYLKYSREYYIELFQGIFAPGISPSFWVELSFPSITAVSFVILICNKKYQQLRISYLLSFGALLIPLTGYFMNGFSYVTNRWCFLISLLVAFAFTMTFDQLFELQKLEKTLLIIVTAGYGIITFAFPSENNVKYAFIILLFTIIFIEVLQMKWFMNRNVLQKVSLYVLVILTLGFQGYAYYSPQFYGYENEFLSKKEVENTSSKGALSLISDIKDKSFYRIETYGVTSQNEALNLGFHDVSGYYSLMDGNVTSYFKELELLEQRTAISFSNMDNRTTLDALSSVKYFVSTDKTAAPYGYKLLKEVKDGANSYYLFQNQFTLPIGYTYENYMLEEDYNKLSALEKQNAMMYAVILDKDSQYVGKENQNINTGIEKQNVKVIPDNNIELSDDLIKVKKPGATITLEFNSKSNSETYVRLHNLNFNKKIDAMSTLTAQGENKAIKYINVRSSYHSSYFGKENYLINAGYSSTGINKITITFPKEETFSYSSLDVYSMDMNYYKTQIETLNKSSLRNVKQNNNSIEGDVTLEKKGVMALSIPYSKGWCAYVDGNKTDLLRGNIMYTALPLEAGEHHIVLKYETPFLKLGCIISGIAFLLFIGVILFHKRNCLKQSKEFN